MLLSEFFMDHKKESKSMQMKIIEDIIAYEANWIFADTVIKILVKKYPYDDRDENVKLQIREFQAQRDASFEGKWHLEKLYESEYGYMLDEVKKQIKETAVIFANIPLVKFGWIKETTTV